MKKISVFLVALIFLGSMLVIHTGNTLYAKNDSKTPCKTKVVKCPVSGEVIAKDAKKITTEYKGKTYYFCCEKCKVEFEKNPEKCVKACDYKAVYTCPMKECNYKSDKPGKCPKCGMELKKAKFDYHIKSKCSDKKETKKEEK